MMRRRTFILGALTLIALSSGVTALTLNRASAAEPGSFALQITPSPLVTTLKPGQTTNLELKIRNAGTTPENLKIEPRSFKLDKTTGDVNLSDEAPADINGWVTFGAPKFSVQPGQWYTQKIQFALPKDTGFSYSFALVVSRQKELQLTTGGRLIKGAVAVFTLINVDRPGATRQLQVAHFKSSKHVYEYLPSDMSIEFKNTGNSIVQPYGNIFITRGGKTQITTLPVNEQQGYILPGVQRQLNIGWNDGFPHYETTTGSDNKSQRHLVWRWQDIAKFRIGKYTAKLVAVYNDGGRDVPIEGEVSFWVIPWKILLGAFVLILLVLFGVWTMVRRIARIGRKLSGKRGKPGSKPDTPEKPAP